MRRPEFLTSAVLAVAGMALALWLAANRVPPTPDPPVPPVAADGVQHLATIPERVVPSAPVNLTLPDIALGHNGLPCGPSLSVVPGPPGFAVLSVNAPCRVDQIVEVTHGPVRFAARLSDRGTLGTAMPIVDAGAGFSADIGGNVLSADALANVKPRVLSGVQWTAPLDLTLAAYEFGAAQALRAAGTGGVGQVLRLGEPGLGPMTEIYVGPDAAGPGVVRLHVEARTRAESCDALQPLNVFRTEAAALVVRDIRLRLEGCDVLGRRVLLKNLVEDLKIASR